MFPIVTWQTGGFLETNWSSFIFDAVFTKSDAESFATLSATTSVRPVDTPKEGNKLFTPLIAVAAAAVPTDARPFLTGSNPVLFARPLKKLVVQLH